MHAPPPPTPLRPNLGLRRASVRVRYLLMFGNTWMAIMGALFMGSWKPFEGGTTLNQTRIETHTIWVKFKAVFFIPITHFGGHVAYQCFQ